MIYYITIAGTFGAKHEQDWYHPDSDFSKFLLKHGCQQLEANPIKRYMWSTEVDGINSDNNTWDAAGRALAHYIAPPLLNASLVKPENTYIVAHSHGGNVVAYACGKYGLKVNGLITVGTPIRKDLHDVYKAALPNISRHLHLYAGWRDYWQVWGALFDGRFGIHRKHPFATRNCKVPKGDHGSVLRDQEFFPLWLERGWLDFWMGKSDGR
jgi:pimeloyl-ACP methyl ester carboxylesterase